MVAAAASVSGAVLATAPLPEGVDVHSGVGGEGAGQKRSSPRPPAACSEPLLPGSSAQTDPPPLLNLRATVLSQSLQMKISPCASAEASRDPVADSLPGPPALAGVVALLVALGSTARAKMAAPCVLGSSVATAAKSRAERSDTRPSAPPEATRASMMTIA